MKHFWINLDKSVHRKKFMSEQFEKSQLENYRIQAITPDDFDDKLVQKRPLTCKYPGCTTCEYEFACLCSHIKAIQEGLKQGDDYFAILEDDIRLPFDIDYESLLNDIPKDTEILQLLILYGNTVAGLYNHYISTGQKFINWQYLLPSAGFYIISKEGGKKIVEQFYNKELDKYDFSSSPYQIVADVLLYETVKTYATTIPYAVPFSELGSDIHPDHIPAHEKAIRVIKVVQEQHNIKPFPYVKRCL